MEWRLISSSSQRNFLSFPWFPTALGSFTCATRSTRIQHVVPHLSDWTFSLVDWLENKVDCWTRDELEFNLGLLLCITLAHDCWGENPSAALPLEWSYKTTSQLGSFSDKHIIKANKNYYFFFFFFKGQQFQLYNNFLKNWHDIPSKAAEVMARQNICAAKSCHGMNKQNPTGVLVHNYTPPNLIWSLFLSAGIICLALCIGIILLLQVPQPLCLHSLLHFSSSFSVFHISPSPPPLAMFLYLFTFN